MINLIRHILRFLLVVPIFFVGGLVMVVIEVMCWIFMDEDDRWGR
jgi:phage shock protein PspC (stress-responsive transcriptional regulator)